MEKRFDLDAPLHYATAPDLGLGDLLRYGPLFEEVAAVIQEAIAHGSLTTPPLPVKIAGRHLQLVMTISVDP